MAEELQSIKKPEEIISEAYKKISDLKNNIISLNNSCLEFVHNYDEYNDKYLFDASLLKERMANAVRMAASNDV